VAAGRLEIAIEVLKKIEDTFGKREDTTKRIQELHKQMLDYQKKSMSEMVTISIGEPADFDAPEMQQVAIKLVMGKSLKDALYSLAFGCNNLIQNYDHIESEAKQDMESYKTHFIPKAHIDQEGKTKAISGDGKDDLKEYMFKNTNFYQGWYGLNFIAPACNQICSEHDLKLDDLSFIFYDNSLIPKGREPIYARGLLAGLQGDLVVASHLLIPQLENSLRHILKLNGHITSDLGIQNDYTLGKVLELSDLEQVLAKETIFTLRCLLTESLGSNFRNEICHGLFDHHQFFAPQLAYLWWLILYLCLVPSYKNWVNENQEK